MEVTSSAPWWDVSGDIIPIKSWYIAQIQSQFSRLNEAVYYGQNGCFYGKMNIFGVLELHSYCIYIQSLEYETEKTVLFWDIL